MKKRIVIGLLFVGAAYGAYTDNGKLTHEEWPSSNPNYLNAIPGERSSEQRRKDLLRSHKLDEQVPRATILDASSRRNAPNYLNAAPALNSSHNTFLPPSSEPTHESLKDIQERLGGTSFQVPPPLPPRRSKKPVASKAKPSPDYLKPDAVVTQHNALGLGDEDDFGTVVTRSGRAVVQDAPAPPPRRSKKPVVKKSKPSPDYLEPHNALNSDDEDDFGTVVTRDGRAVVQDADDFFAGFESEL